MAMTSTTSCSKDAASPRLWLGIWLALCGGGLFLGLTEAASSVDLFVSPTGDDGLGDGTIGKPFQSLARAQLEVKTIQTVSPSLSINVNLREGRYELKQTLDFAASDGGTVGSDARVVYQAYCPASYAAQATSVLKYPYSSHLATPPRLLWNGMGNSSLWLGPTDPFAQMGVNFSGDSLLAAPATAGASSSATTTTTTTVQDICVDRVNVGHVCYVGRVGDCIRRCQSACISQLERVTYSPQLYTKFSHLFGKKLELEEDCIENCAVSCRGCERAELSGSLLITSSSGPKWSIYKTLPITQLTVFQMDLSTVLPASVANISQVFVDNLPLVRASFPDCAMNWSTFQQVRNYRISCGFLPAQILAANVFAFNAAGVGSSSPFILHAPMPTAAQLSSRMASWTSIPNGVLHLLPNATNTANLIYSLDRVDNTQQRFVVSAGGAQKSDSTFFNGPVEFANDSYTSTLFRVANLMEELDAPGEFFFNPTSRKLFVIPWNKTTTLADLSQSQIEIPLLRQLVRVSGARDNHFVNATHALEDLNETFSTPIAANLVFRQLVFSGTILAHTDVYETLPGATRPIARFAGLYLENVVNITVEQCIFEKMEGNALMVSGQASQVQIVNNEFDQVGANAISVVARQTFRLNSFHQQVSAELLFASDTNVSFNSVHATGFHDFQSAALLIVASQQTRLVDNLIYDLYWPNVTQSYVVQNALGNGVGTLSKPLVRAIAPFSIDQTLANSLATQYTIQLPVKGFDIPIVAKLVGAPECVSGSGRVGALYDWTLPLACSGCCSTNDNLAKIRIAGSSLAWPQATREVVVWPGDTLELMSTSSSILNSPVDVYLMFHVLTPNQLIDLSPPLAQVRWRILTRKCVYSDQTYRATCGGPCNAVNAPACGSLSQEMRWNPPSCRDGFESDANSLVCQGPFERIVDCDNSGVLTSHLYYDCSISCFATFCS